MFPGSPDFTSFVRSRFDDDTDSGAFISCEGYGFLSSKPSVARYNYWAGIPRNEG